jgi:hypothetical protein
MSGYQQFRTRAEAEQAIEDMERRASKHEAAALRARAMNHGMLMTNNSTIAAEYRDEAERIRKLLSTLPEVKP